MTAMPRTKDDIKFALPDVTSTLSLKGLDGTIEIFRDRYGIPHVRAQTPHDAFFGQGFVTAQDRLWHMDYDRRRAYGRWAELVGPSAVEQDRMTRRFQIGPTVRQDYEAVNAETRAMLDAYAAGVNAFIETTKALPIEYRITGATPESWQPWDCLAVFKVRHILMGVFEGKLWRAKLVNTFGPEKAASLLKGYQPGHLVIVPPGDAYDGPVLDGLNELAEGMEALGWLKACPEPVEGEGPDAGSNNWAVHGSRTASGKPLLAGDPHRPLDTPNVYYQNHIACPDFDVIGLSFPGFPGFPHFGHNASVAWCVTHAQADYQDLFVERFRDGDSTRYEFKGQWKQAEVRREVINVRDGSPVELDVTVTHHGPVIAGDPEKGHGIAFRYTATAELNLGFQCILPMLRATSADEIEESMREWVDPGNNFVFADVHGNIGYLNRNKLPVRPMANAWLPVPGWTGEHEWKGYVPFEKLVRSRNPDIGYIVTANNRIAGQDYPHYIALTFASEYRARRIIERLKPLTKATAEDMAAVHADRVSIPAQIFIALISEIEPLDELSARAKERLSNWDCSLERDAVAPIIFAAFRGRLLRMVIGHLMGPLADEMFSATGRGAPNHLQSLATWINTGAMENDTSMLPPGEDWRSIVAKALAQGVADLKQQLGDDIDSWHWGRVHRTQPKHMLSSAFPEMASLLDPPSVSLGGGLDTPQAAGHSPAGTSYEVSGTSVARYVFDTADWDNSCWIVPLGASGHPGSPHYADQAETWADVDSIPMTYDWEKIKSDAGTTQELSKG